MPKIEIEVDDLVKGRAQIISAMRLQKIFKENMEQYDKWLKENRIDDFMIIRLRGYKKMWDKSREGLYVEEE